MLKKPNLPQLPAGPVQLFDGQWTNEKPTEEPIDALRRRVIEGHQRTTVFATASAVCALEAGVALLEVKARLKHGKFLPWIDQHITPNCGMKRRTAQTYMNLARNHAELLDRIREVRTESKSVEFDHESAERILSSMKLKDAISLLKMKNGEQRQSDSEQPKNRRRQTPTEIGSAVVQFLGQIDLDPCVGLGTADHALATYQLNLIDEGPVSHQVWQGRLFVYPPDDGTLSDWVDRCVREYAASAIDEAVLLLPSKTAATWMPLLESFPRVHLWDKIASERHGNRRKRGFAAAVFMLANEQRIEAFDAAFKHLGKLFVPYSREN